MKEIFIIILAAVSATVAIKLNIILTKLGLSTIESIVTSSAIASIGFTIIKTLLIEYPLYSKLGRKILDPRSKYEGIYIEHLETLENRPVSLSRILYNPKKKSYSYRGKAFDINGNIMAKWSAVDIQIDTGEGIVKYFFEATITQDNTESVRGYGVIDFNINSGYFVDTGSNLAEWHHSIKKLSHNDVSRILENKYSLGKDSWKKIEKALIKDFTVNI